MGIVEGPQTPERSEGASHEGFLAEQRALEQDIRQKTFALIAGVLILLCMALIVWYPETAGSTVAGTFGNILAQYALYHDWFARPIGWAQRMLPRHRGFARFVTVVACVGGCFFGTVGFYDLASALVR